MAGRFKYELSPEGAGIWRTLTVTDTDTGNTKSASLCDGDSQDAVQTQLALSLVQEYKSKLDAPETGSFDIPKDAGSTDQEPNYTDSNHPPAGK